ncbi:MAG TPA: ABC transporter permease [Polyangia bacterium]|jgi:sodium transport system permease protein
MSAVLAVLRKELVDVLRDRRTLVFMLAVPTLAIPLLMWALTALVTQSTQRLARERLPVLVVNPEAAPDLLARLRARADTAEGAAGLGRLLAARGLTARDLALAASDDPDPLLRLLRRRGVDPAALRREARAITGRDDLELDARTLLALLAPPRLDLVAAAAGDPARDPARRAAALRAAVRAERVTAAIAFPADAPARLAAGEAAEVTLYYLAVSDRSTAARDALHQVLRDTGTRITRERLAARGLPGELTAPLKARSSRLPGPGALVKLVSQLVPYLIILFAFLGAMYPAIDLGAGEKERGTLETLLLAPVSRQAIILGKFGAILVASIVSAVLATLSLVVSLQLGFLAGSAAAGDPLTLRAGEALAAILLVVPVGCIFSALLLGLSVYAKGFKEAQSYASPLLIGIILPAFVSFLPGVRLDYRMAALPIVNLSLALREIFIGDLDQRLGELGLVLGSTALEAALLLWLTARFARREAVLFRS